MKKAYKNLKGIKKACEEVTSCISGSDKFMYRCFPLMIELLENINDTLTNLASTLKAVAITRKRKPSAYNLHIGREMASGKSMQEAAASWKSLKK